jgi:hypothetical protein
MKRTAWDEIYDDDDDVLPPNLDMSRGIPATT